jgi:hypothetical protein
VPTCLPVGCLRAVAAIILGFVALALIFAGITLGRERDSLDT